MMATKYSVEVRVTSFSLDKLKRERNHRERERKRERDRDRSTMACTAAVNLGLASSFPSPSLFPSSSSMSSINKPLFSSSQISFVSSSNHNFAFRFDGNHFRKTQSPNATNFQVVVAASSAKKPEPLKIMISGAPASGKGTQSELITAKYGLVHIAAGDLLRTEIARGSENGKKAKEYMEKGQLVPDEIVVMMVKERLSQPDCQQNGWLLDGYPRSTSQAAALQKFGFQPDLFIVLEVSEDILVERVVGRRLDPVTGKIYHLKYSPPETEEIAARLTQRFDDTEEKVKLRLKTHNQNVEAVLSLYEDITIKVNGNASKEDVFAQIDNALAKLIEQREPSSGSLVV